jgi:mucin-19
VANRGLILPNRPICLPFPQIFGLVPIGIGFAELYAEAMFKRAAKFGLVSCMAAATLVAPTPASAATATASCSSGTCTVSVTDTSTDYQWTVPAGITSVSFTITGGQGGAGAIGNAAGGLGGKFTGTLAVSGGQVISMWAGAAGGAGSTASSLSGGRNSGGGGGSSTRVGGAGGAHSQINRAGVLVAVAGGGGGGGGWSGGAGGGGGSSTFSSGVANGVSGTNAQSFSGAGGSTSGGGGGAASGGGGSPGTSGASLSGGSGGAGSAGSGGGGGGGYFGGGGAGGDNDTSGADGAGGGGGSNYFNSTSVSAVTGFAAAQSGNGSIVITYPSTAVSSFAPSTSLTNSTSLSFSIVFSESVTGFTSSDLSLVGTGSSSCTIGTITGSGNSYSIPLTSCSQGTIGLTITANSVSGTTTGPSSNVTSSYSTIDLTAPTISSTLTGPANATYIPTQSLTFTAPFSETVTVTGTPRLALTIGSTTRYANYVSGTNTRTLTFTYVVQTALADVDTDGISLATSLEPNSGSIQDLASNALSNFTFTAPTLTSVLVAQRPAAPTIDSITATSGQLAIAFTAGASNGSAITNYEFSTNNGVNWTTRSPIATTSPLTITGLTNGQSYNVRLRAINSAGSGESSTAVSATPTAVVVGGGSDISITYGQSGSTSAFSATGGTGTYTYSLSATPSGVSISGSTVTASSSTPAGRYTQNVIATDNGSTPQSGSKAFTINVAKASTTISISLPNSATNAALGGAVTITATVSRAGAVNFRLGGSTISGCGSSAAATTTATCSWTPASLGSVSLTAIFTPTDASNFETSTSTTLSINVVNGVSTVTLSLAGGTTTPPKGQAINIIAAVDQAGRITFLIDGKRIPGCINRNATAGNVTCSWKPAVQKAVTISARLTPSNNIYNASSSSMSVQVVRRSGTR